jgi:hypothetical protein
MPSSTARPNLLGTGVITISASRFNHHLVLILKTMPGFMSLPLQAG